VALWVGGWAVRWQTRFWNSSRINHVICSRLFRVWKSTV